MSVKEQLSKLEQHLAAAKLEEEKLASGSKRAAANLRASLLEIGKGCSETRKLALDAGKAVPVKKRIPKQESKVESLEVKEGDTPAELVEAPSRKPRKPRAKKEPVAAA